MKRENLIRKGMYALAYMAAVMCCIICLPLKAEATEPESYVGVTFCVDDFQYEITADYDIDLRYGEVKLIKYQPDTSSTITNLEIPAKVPYNVINRTFRVTSIEEKAFYQCTNLESITIPSSVTRIGDSAFYDCSKLTSITLPTGLTSIGPQVFADCSSLESISIPSGVTSIGLAAFYGCSSLKSISIPSGVTRIGSSAFNSCTGLKSVSMQSGVTIIDDMAFYGCSSLTNISIPSSVTIIGSMTFDSCSSLESISIPGSVTSIGSSAFEGCSGLKSVSIQSGVTGIESCDFKGCSSLTSVSIPSSVKSIGSSAFEGCSSLTSVSIPSSVTSIGSSAFEGCGSLTSITVQEGVRRIYEYAFYGCSNLERIIIPNSVISIGNDAFFGCPNSLQVILNCDYKKYNLGKIYWSDYGISESQIVKVHNFGEYESDNNATCTTDGTKTAKCTGIDCNEKKTITDVGSKGCKPGEQWYFDETSHWKKCSCGNILNKANHNFVNDTCKDCGYSNDKVNQFLSRIYSDCLQRTPDPSGIDYWSNELKNGAKDGANVGAGFVFSEEYVNKAVTKKEYLTMLYKVFMNREADKEGLDFWLDKMRNGMTREEVFKGFVESPEYTQICADYGIKRGDYTLQDIKDPERVNGTVTPEITSFVERIYDKALGRESDPQGIKYWSKEIADEAISPIAVAEYFIISPEFEAKKLDDTEYVKVLYRTFMGREYDDDGLKYWLGRMQNGDTRQKILEDFASCPEFQDIIKSFGL